MECVQPLSEYFCLATHQTERHNYIAPTPLQTTLHIICENMKLCYIKRSFLCNYRRFANMYFNRWKISKVLKCLFTKHSILYNKFNHLLWIRIWDNFVIVQTNQKKFRRNPFLCLPGQSLHFPRSSKASQLLCLSEISVKLTMFNLKEHFQFFLIFAEHKVQNINIKQLCCKMDVKK